MTRFARASGSKGANERRPEDSTNWLELKAKSLKEEKKCDESSKVLETPSVMEIPSTDEIKTVWADLLADAKVDQHINKNVSHKKKRSTKDKQLNCDDDIKMNGNKESFTKNEKSFVNVTVKKKVAEDSVMDGELVSSRGVFKKKRKSIGKEDSNVMQRNESLVTKKRRKVSSANGNLVDCHEPPNMKTKKKRRQTTTPQIDEYNVVPFENDDAPEKRKKKSMLVSKNLEGRSGKINAKIEKIKRKTMPATSSDFHNTNKELANKLQKPREKKRRKAELQASEVIINGKTVNVKPFDGFMVLAEDSERLAELRKTMIQKGIDKKEMERAMKLERRRAEKVLQRLKRQVCFHCRGSGHVLSECPLVAEDQRATGICYKCGSTEHTHFQCRVSRGDDFRYAECFICKEQGHIAKQCPDNPRGLYPRGGACTECGDVTHLKKDCPKYVSKQQEDGFSVATRNDRTLEALDEDLEVKTTSINPVPRKKHIRFE